MYFKNKIKKSVILVAFAASTNVYASTTPDLESLECTAAELAPYIDKSNVKDNTSSLNLSLKEFEAANREIKIKEIEASPNSADLIKEDCLTVMGNDFDDFMKQRREDFENMMKALKGLRSGGFDVSAILDPLWEKIKEEFNEQICKAADSVGDFATAAQNDFINAGKKEFAKRMREEGLDVLTDPNKMDRFLTQLTKKELNDEKGLLKWKNGQLDKDNFTSKLQSTSGKQADKKIHSEIKNLFDGF